MKHVSQIIAMRETAERELRSARNLREQARKEREQAANLLLGAERHEREAEAAAQTARDWTEIADRTFTAGIPDTFAALAPLTAGQRGGTRCYLCDGEITDEYPDELLGDLGGCQVFVHTDGGHCETEAAERATGTGGGAR